MNFNKSIVSIVSYLFAFFLGSMIIQTIVFNIYAFSNGYSISYLYEVLNNHGADSNALIVANQAMSLTNFLVYLLIFIILIFINYKSLNSDGRDFSRHLKRNIIYILIGFVLLYGISILIGYLISLADIPDSNNQSSIIYMIYYGYAPLVFISVVMFAPIVEEYIYRYCVYDIFKNRSKVAYYLLSVIFFALPHMLSSNTDLKVWILQLIPYLASGLILALIYDYSKNIYVSIGVHLLNNLLVFILLVV